MSINPNAANNASLPACVVEEVTLLLHRQETLSRVKTVLVALTGIVITTAGVLLEDPVAPVAKVSIALLDAVGPMPNQAMASVRSVVAARATRPVDGEVQQVALVASEPQPRGVEQAPSPLLNQFMAWAQDQEAQEQMTTPPAQDAPVAVAAASPADMVADAPVPAQMAQDEARAPQRAAPQAFRNARAEAPAQHHRIAAHRQQARADSAQNAAGRSRSLLQILGLRD